MKRNKPPTGLPSREQVTQFELAEPMLTSLYREMKELSKKSPDGTLNAVKVKMINRVLSDLKTALEHEPSTAYLDLLEDSSLPSNSDVVLILSQYEAACERFRGRYTHGEFDELMSIRKWTTSEDS